MAPSGSTWVFLLAAACAVLSVVGATPPQPPVPPQMPPVAALAPPGACETLGPCELFAELQEHSRRIAGFSYNVKKADAALTTLARQQTAASERAQKLAEAMQQLEVGLESVMNGGGNATNATNGAAAAGGSSLLLLPARAPSPAPVVATAAPGYDWDQAAARELARLGDRLTRLREQVNTSFIRTLRENGEELGQLRVRVATLHVQVADLEAAVRGEMVGRRVTAEGDFPSEAPVGSSAAPPTTTASSAAQTGATGPPEDRGQVSSSSGGDGGGASSSSVGDGGPVANATVESTSPSTGSVDGTQEAHAVAPGNGNESANGNGNGNGNGESVDTLGIELETVRTEFETLHTQVTELQARCDSRGDELEALVVTLERRLAGIEAAQLGTVAPDPAADGYSNGTILAAAHNTSTSEATATPEVTKRNISTEITPASGDLDANLTNEASNANSENIPVNGTALDSPVTASATRAQNLVTLPSLPTSPSHLEEVSVVTEGEDLVTPTDPSRDVHDSITLSPDTVSQDTTVQ